MVFLPWARPATSSSLSSPIRFLLAWSAPQKERPSGEHERMLRARPLRGHPFERRGIGLVSRRVHSPPFKGGVAAQRPGWLVISNKIRRNHKKRLWFLLS